MCQIQGIYWTRGGKVMEPPCQVAPQDSIEIEMAVTFLSSEVGKTVYVYADFTWYDGTPDQIFSPAQKITSAGIWTFVLYPMSPPMVSGTYNIKGGSVRESGTLKELCKMVM